MGKNHKIAVALDFTGFAGSCRFSQKRHIENILCSGAHPIILKGQNPVSSLSSHPHSKTTLQNHTANPSGTAAQFHSTFRSGNPDNPTSIASHITVSSYTAALSQCHFRSIIQSIPHTLRHQEISTFRSVTHALVVSQQTHAVMFRLLLLHTESCKIQRGFLQLLPISRCLFTPHFICVRILCDQGRNDKKEQQQSYAAALLSVAVRIIIFAFYRIMRCAL